MNYLEESERTTSGEFFGTCVNTKRFITSLCHTIEYIERLDYYKKLLFYGPDESKGRFPCVGTTGHLAAEICIDQNILHGVLGVATESGELLEAVNKSLTTGDIDTVNLTEEIGDVMWYLAMLCRALGTDFETVCKINIDKLKVRFPDKFTSEAANQRDLFAERAALES